VQVSTFAISILYAVYAGVLLLLVVLSHKLPGILSSRYAKVVSEEKQVTIQNYIYVGIR
jgi:hypothetical protein